MADIALIGATGNIGTHVCNEALARGHRVTGTTRDAAKLPPHAGLTPAVVQLSDRAKLAAVLKGHDVAVVSIRWDANDIGLIIEAIRQARVPRAIFVVGAGSLLRADGRLHFDHTQPPSPSSKPAMVALDRLREVKDLDWTAISPPTSILPGERTGRFRLGTDTMVVDAADNGRISREDFAVAILDEVENPQYIRRRFTAGY